MTPATPARLLVVDDEPLLMRSLCETLREQGYDTAGSTSASAALVLLRDHPVDLLLADLAMPGMDGITLLREALKIDDMLVGVIMTGEGTIGTAVEAMRSGAYDYVLKPFKLGTIRPVLERGLAMRALRVENAALEQRLRDRAVELEATNRELDAFTRSASHDLRSPLSRVLGIAQMLSTRFGHDLPEEAAQWVQQIEIEGGQMMTLLEDLMRLSRLGRQALELALVDVGKVVREVTGELRAQAAGRSLEFRVGVLPPATADAGLLRQVFVNLLSNAVKFTRGRAPAVVEVGCDRADDAMAYFVQDNGTGFDMTHADKLFGAFQRLHRPDDFEGNGIGLSIVERIVTRHGGRVWAEGAVDHGAIFHFTLGS